MLELFQYIQNLGRYRQARGTDNTRLRPLTLVFSENGKGKTTLCSILRSLSDGSAGPIAERKRLDNTDPTRVALQVDGTTANFDSSQWNTTRPDIFVFDEQFIDDNVYSGLSVNPSHRQGVHELVLGVEGVHFQRRVQELTDKVAAIQAVIREKTNAIPAEARHGLSVDDFCALQPVEDLDSKIDEAEKSVAVLSDTEPIRQAAHFRAFALPSIDAEEVRSLLRRSLDDLDQAALEAVKAHVASVGPDAERWLSQGEGLRGDADSCPFCGQDVSGSNLVGHYRAYFSDTYRAHKDTIASLRNSVRLDLDGDSLASFERGLQQVRDNAHFWSRFVAVPEIDLDSGAIASAWTSLRESLDEALAQKQAVPLDAVDLSPACEQAIARYCQIAEEVRSASNSLLETREAIEAAKEQAGQGNLGVARAQLDRLRAVRSRFATEMNLLCSELQSEKVRKQVAETERSEAREALEEQRERVFSAYQTSLNQILVRLSAEFSVEALEPSDRGRGGQPSTVYCLKVNKARVHLAPTENPAPSFKTALSAGDRNTLALAFFFATLESRDLRNSIVVIDDPATSLDRGRKLKTIQQIYQLVDKAHQLIVLSHSEELLCRLWGKASPANTATLQIRSCGEEESTIEHWDAEASSETDHDRVFGRVSEYAASHVGDPQQVAQDLRILLESFLRVSFPDYYEPGKPIGTFLQNCKNAQRCGASVLPVERIREIEDLLEYANLFHHSTNQFGWRDALAGISETELHAHARDTIALIKKLRGAQV